MKASPVVFHAGYYRTDKNETFEIVSDAIKKIMKATEKNSWNVLLAPETAGRASQFGSLDEILLLAVKTGCYFCIDPAHLYARNLGRIDFGELFSRLAETKERHLHFHFTGIEYGPRGEIRHTILGRPDFAEFASQLLKSDIDSTIISESPVTWRDSLRMKKILENLGYNFEKRQLKE